MGNASSVSSAFQAGSPSKSGCASASSCNNGGSGSKKSKSSKSISTSAAAQAAETATERAKKVFGDVQESLKSSVKKLEEQDHPAAHLIDTVCGPYFDSHGGSHSRSRKMRENRSASFYSEDYNSDDSRTLSEDEQTLDTDYNASTVNGSTVASSTAPPKKGNPLNTDSSYLSQSDYESSEVGNGRSHRHRSKSKRDKHRRHKDDDPSSTAGHSDDDDSKTMESISVGQGPQQLLSKPLASSFAKRCYFTKAGIGKTTQHYEGLTLTGNVVLMLAAAMKLKGCPTICDEDLRRVEQTYPNQFSRLPDELLLSSGWRRISKYCHFSNKPVPDGIPFFHSKQRLHPQGGYYFLLAAAVGMVRPIDVEPLTRDTLVLLETDYPTQCDAAPEILIQDPDEWTLVDKFCFFSGGPINTEEDVYYQADFDGNPIYMLAFLSPSLTPEELYKLEAESEDAEGNPIPGLTSVAAVQDVESVYDLTDRDFHDLKLYHLGPCRALPQYILQPQAWTKVLPPHFLEARHQAVLRAQEYEMANGGPVTPVPRDPMVPPAQQLTVGATPLDGRQYGGGDGAAEYQAQMNMGQMPVDPNQRPPYDEAGAPPHHLHHQEGQPGPNLSEDNAYFMPPSNSGSGVDAGGYHHAGQQQQAGFTSEYETVGAHNSMPMADSNTAAYNQLHHGHGHHPHHGQTPPPPHQPYADQQQQHHYHDQHQQQQQPHAHHPQDLPHGYHHESPTHQQQQHYPMQGSPHHQNMEDQYHHQQYEEDERSPHSADLQQREVEEEGAFMDTQLAPMDEAMSTRKAGPPGTNMMHNQGMDPPEHLPTDQDIDESADVSEAMTPNPNNVSNASDSYYSHPDEPLENQYSDDMRSPARHGDAPSYGTPASPYGTPASPNGATPQYSYSVSPEKGDDQYYQHPHHLQHPEQARDDQYYDSPDGFVQEGLKEQPGSQDHEFFNAPSGGGDEDEDYETSHVSSFDPHGHIGRHPDDYHHSNMGGGYYEDEGDSRLEVQESSSVEYFHGGPEDSPSPIKMDHLRRLGRKKAESPLRPSAVTSPTSQASSQNSISEYSHSSAMRGAQELLKRNRQRRHEQARRRLNANNEVRTNNSADTEGSPIKSPTHYALATGNGYLRSSGNNGGTHRADDGSASTWESGNSEALNSVISGSSVWTDNSSNPADRSSRRALILQMAKARMKSNKERDPAEKTIKEEKSNSLDDTDPEDYGDDHRHMQPEELTEVHTSSATELDIAADLD